MSKQWGHGYYNGVKAAQHNNGTMAGLWFHSRKDGNIHLQGQIVRDLKNGSYVVQLYSWLDGNPTDQKIVLLEEIKEWTFYKTDFDMRKAYHKEVKRKDGITDEDFEWSEEIRRKYKMIR